MVATSIKFLQQSQYQSDSIVDNCEINPEEFIPTAQELIHTTYYGTFENAIPDSLEGMSEIIQDLHNKLHAAFMKYEPFPKEIYSFTQQENFNWYPATLRDRGYVVHEWSTDLREGPEEDLICFSILCDHKKMCAIL